MPTDKLAQHEEYLRKMHKNRLESLKDIHHEDRFFETGLGNNLLELKNAVHDLAEKGKKITSKEIKAVIGNQNIKTELRKFIYARVGHLIKEAEYLKNVACAIENEKHDSKHLEHFVENIESYAVHLKKEREREVEHLLHNFRHTFASLLHPITAHEHKLAGLLEKNVHLLRTLLHKDELRHFAENLHNDDVINKMKERFGENKTGKALYHFIEQHTKLKSLPEKLIERGRKVFSRELTKHEVLFKIADMLNERAEILEEKANKKIRKIIGKQIKAIEYKWEQAKKKSSKLLDEALEHHSKMERFYRKIGL
ncbi:hypothetical protein HYU06_00580 [Candidatus Woesearchaeota archaeon]|nr:hypothetical protein [Candidatus Woesearchaeota archaeon]